MCQSPACWALVWLQDPYLLFVGARVWRGTWTNRCIVHRGKCRRSSCSAWACHRRLQWADLWGSLEGCSGLFWAGRGRENITGRKRSMGRGTEVWRLWACCRHLQAVLSRACYFWETGWEEGGTGWWECLFPGLPWWYRGSGTLEESFRALSSAWSFCLEGLPVGKGRREEGSGMNSGRPGVQSAAHSCWYPTCLGKALSLSQPQFLYLLNETGFPYPRRLLGGLREAMRPPSM